MKTRIKMIVMGLVMVTMLLLATGSAAARATKTDVEVVDYGCWLTNLGVSWVDEEGVLHTRGQMYEGITVSADVRFVGASAIDDASLNMDLSTGDYTLHGTGTLDPSNPNIDGIWEIMFNSRFIDGVLTARGVAHGTGDLAGLKAKIIIEAMDPSQPSPYCGGAAPQYVSKWIMSVLDPHGE